jgi:hypothetical protein
MYMPEDIADDKAEDITEDIPDDIADDKAEEGMAGGIAFDLGCECTVEMASSNVFKPTHSAPAAIAGASTDNGTVPAVAEERKGFTFAVTTEPAAALGAAACFLFLAAGLTGSLVRLPLPVPLRLPLLPLLLLDEDDASCLLSDTFRFSSFFGDANLLSTTAFAAIPGAVELAGAGTMGASDFSFDADAGLAFGFIVATFVFPCLYLPVMAMYSNSPALIEANGLESCEEDSEDENEEVGEEEFEYGVSSRGEGDREPVEGRPFFFAKREVSDET